MKSRHLFSLLLIVVLTALPFAAFAVTGTGTASDPYVVDPSTAQAFINSVDAHDAYIKLSAGNYGTLEFKSSTINHKNLTLVGESGTKVEGIYVTVHQHDVANTLANLTIKNIEFTGIGVGSNNVDVAGWNIVNCKFTGNSQVSLRNKVAKNITIDSCQFIYDSSAASNINAIIFNHIDGLTVTNCVFSNVPYNAIQANDSVNGNIQIVGNNFDTNNRVIKLKGYNDTSVGTVTISNNYFADPSDTSGKTDGNYVESTKPIVLGSNQYETDPATKPELFLTNAVLPAPAPVVPSTPSVPKTGDNSNIALWIALMAISALSFVALGRKSRFN